MRQNVSRVKEAVRVQLAMLWLLAADTRAQAGGGAGNAASKGVAVVVGLMVGGLVAAFLLPLAINEIVGVNTTDWSSGATSLWGILDIVLVLAVFLFFVGVALQGAEF